jgi:hypothetical protein
MDNLTEIDCCSARANVRSALPSVTSGSCNRWWRHGRSGGGRTYLILAVGIFSVACLVAGCGQDASQPAADAKPATPAVPQDVQDAADALLGKETTVLLVGDLAKNGKQQFLAANVVPKTPKNNLPGTIVTRAVLAENNDGKWMEILRCDEHLKNEKGFLPGTPIGGVTGWRVAYEQDPEKGLALYFTPLKGAVDTHSLPIGIRWNPETKRYQSLDRSYEHFLLESPALNTARSSLR